MNAPVCTAVTSHLGYSDWSHNDIHWTSLSQSKLGIQIAHMNSSHAPALCNILNAVTYWCNCEDSGRP